jgi:tetratricopeptide (TPR) repeat protein
VHHFGNKAKDRTSYLPLLELAVAEDPDDDRNMHYLGREYLYSGQWARAEDTFRRHLDMKRALWRPERAASMRYLAEVIWLRRHDLPGGTEEVESWLLRAAAEAPDYREGWYALMQHYLRTDRRMLATAMAARGIEVRERALDYITTPEPWSGAMEALVAGAPTAQASVSVSEGG